MSLIAAALKPRSILIATDFSEASEKALRYSLALARFYESKFCLAHVVSSLGLTMAGPGAIAACEEAVSREAADLEDSLIQTGDLTGIQHKFISLAMPCRPCVPTTRRSALSCRMRCVAQRSRLDNLPDGKSAPQRSQKTDLSQFRPQFTLPNAVAAPGLERPPCAAHSFLRQTSDPHLSTACRKPLRRPISLEPSSPF